jgi:DNA polymerase-1
VGGRVNSRSIRNFPMQPNGAEMLRLACCFATERGITVCAPVHDAILIEAPANQLDSAVARTREAMAEASRIVLDGFTLRTDAKIIRYPDRFQEERGKKMWQTVWDLITNGSPPDTCAHLHMSPVHQRNNTCASARTRPILSISPQIVSYE